MKKYFIGTTHKNKNIEHDNKEESIEVNKQREKPASLLFSQNKDYNNIVNINDESKSYSNIKLVQMCMFKMDEEYSTSNLEHHKLSDNYLLSTKDKLDHSKGSRVSESQKLRILTLYFNENLDYSEIARKLWIGYSTVYRIVNNFKISNDNSSSWFDAKTIKCWN